MSTLREIGIDFARIDMVSELVDEKLVVAGTAEHEEELEFTVTLSLTVFTKDDIDTLRQMATEQHGGAVALYSSR